MSAMSVKAQSVSYAKSLIDQERYLEAAKQLRPLADGGNAEAQYLAAWLFFKGKGVSKSETQGIKYATMATNQGNKDAMMLIMEHFYRTNNHTKIYETCKKYISKHPYLMTSEIGHVLGMCYMEGWGVAKDEERGWEIITKLDDNEFIRKTQKEYSKQWKAYLDCHPELYIEYAKKAANQELAGGISIMIEYYLKTNNHIKPYEIKIYEICKESISKYPHLINSEVGYGLGVCYIEGWGVAKDEEHGWEIITKLDGYESYEFIRKAQEHYANQWEAYLERHPELYMEKVEIIPSFPGETSKLTKMPSFPGGLSKLFDYISHVIYPIPSADEEDEIITGPKRVLVAFVIERDGSVSDAKVVKSVHPILDKAALDAINDMPKWSPGMSNGKAVRVRYTAPIPFK